MHSISEVARLLRVHSQTLRNWERVGLISPKRMGHLRVYSDSDIKFCEEIKKYSKRGIHLQGIKELLKAKNGGDQ